MATGGSILLKEPGSLIVRSGKTPGAVSSVSRDAPALAESSRPASQGPGDGFRRRTTADAAALDREGGPRFVLPRVAARRRASERVEGQWRCSPSGAAAGLGSCGARERPAAAPVIPVRLSPSFSRPRGSPHGPTSSRFSGGSRLVCGRKSGAHSSTCVRSASSRAVPVGDTVAGSSPVFRPTPAGLGFSRSQAEKRSG